MPEGWAWCRLGRITFITKLAGFEYSKYIEPNLCENGIPLFKGKNVQNSEIIYQNKNFLEKFNDISLLADLMGHESIETTRIYLRRTASEQQEIVDEVVTW